MNFDENKIILKCQGGHLESFGALYDAYIKKIYDFIYFKTHHKETAEDLCSKVFMKALNNINNFDMEKGTFSSWIYRIARNSIIDHYRTQKFDYDIEDAWDLKSDDNLERDIDVKQKLESVDKYLKTLKPAQREILVLRVWQQMSYKEIAETLDKTEASCKMQFSRVIKQLRKDIPASALLLLFLIKL